MRFEIYEGNWDSLVKKLKRIENKCAKYGCDFKFEELGEIFKTKKLEDGTEVPVKYIIVDVEGTAVVNDWEFVASIQHYSSGNIISGISDIKVPDRFYHTGPGCEHCNRDRDRKDTYIVRNTKTGEFKQVGKSCLKDFTGGMSAEAVAAFEQVIHECEQGSEFSGLEFSHKWVEVKQFVECAFRVVKEFGYAKTDSFTESTKEKAYTLYLYLNYPTSDEVRDWVKKYNLDNIPTELEEKASDAIEWAKSSNEEYGYMNNLRVICRQQYVEKRNLGILASLPVAYEKELGLIQQRKEREAKAKSEAETSNFVGSIGEKIEIDVVSNKVITSWETSYGTTYVNKFVDNDGNVYIWKSSNAPEEDTVSKLKGTVKAHNEFRGVKQTELTRCKVVETKD